MRRLGHKADYLSDVHTLNWFSKEQYMPSSVIDRGSLDAWVQKGRKTAFERAKERVDQLLDEYKPGPVEEGTKAELRRITEEAAQAHGMAALPPLPAD
jgi:trimethylamine--corrinoid protein Co-methyltransferase